MKHLGADQERYEALKAGPHTIESAIEVASITFPHVSPQGRGDTVTEYMTRNIRNGKLKLSFVDGIVVVEKAKGDR